MLQWWCFFFCKQKTAYEMRISDWSSDVCSSDLEFKLLTQQGLLAQHAGFKQALSATWVRLLKYQATTKMMANKENRAAMWPHKFATLTGWNKKNPYWSKHRDSRFFIPAYVPRRRSPWVQKLGFKRLTKSLYFVDGNFRSEEVAVGNEGESNDR